MAHQIFYRPDHIIEAPGKALFLVSHTGKLYRVVGDIRQQPGVINAPEEISYAVTFDSSATSFRERLVRRYSVEDFSLIEETTHPSDQRFERWIQHNLLPIPDDWVYYENTK